MGEGARGEGEMCFSEAGACSEGEGQQGLAVKACTEVKPAAPPGVGSRSVPPAQGPSPDPLEDEQGDVGGDDAGGDQHGRVGLPCCREVGEVGVHCAHGHQVQQQAAAGATGWRAIQGCLVAGMVRAACHSQEEGGGEGVG